MNRSVLLKLATIVVLILLLLIPLAMIGGVIGERQAASREVLQSIARSSSYSQRLVGPVLIVPYKKTVVEWRVDATTQQRVKEEREVSGRLHFLPELFELGGRLRTEARARGIYQARIYHSDIQVNGHFQLPARLGVGEDYASYRFEQPFLAVGISDIRGIGNALKLKLNETVLDFQPGSRSWLGDGVHAVLPALDGQQAARLDFSFDLQLQGTSLFEIMPVGRETRVALDADWPHPSFMGEYLPVKRQITDQGFSAFWQTSFFSTNLAQALEACVEKEECDEFDKRRFGVSLIDPVDQYVKSDRAVKYALMFIGLTFAGFFLFEVLKRLAIHPIQYGLVGVALALFYLLLLSLSEHIGFTAAYAVSAGACVALIGFYVSHVLRSAARGLGFGLGLTALYGLLYGLLSAEDYALLMGALLLFGVLGLVMVLTRQLDWYGLEKPVVKNQG